MKKLFFWLKYAVGIPAFILGAYLTSSYQAFPWGSLVFGLLAVSLCVLLFIQSRCILDLRLLFTISWLPGIALAGLNLSKRQNPWCLKMWIAVFLVYFTFLACFDAVSFVSRKKKKRKASGIPVVEAVVTDAEDLAQRKKSFSRHLLQAICMIAFAGLLGFLIECIRYDFVLPIMSDKPHAYTEFHISGVHYFVVSLCLVHPLTVYYFMNSGKQKISRVVLLILLNLVCFAVPILILSKFQIIIAIVLPLLAWALTAKKMPNLKILLFGLGALLVSAGLFVLVIKHRHYPEGYLEGIFAFRNPDTPMYIQYPYIYIVNNFENLNLLISKLQHFSFGARQSFPVLALTGLKFVPGVSRILNVEQYLTISELSTRTLIYDAYGDFGLAGVAVLGGVLGAASSFITRAALEKRTVLGVLIYSQLAIYMSLTFFDIWFSNPTTWFWLFMSIAAAFWCTKVKGKFRFSLKEMLHGTGSYNS